MAGLRSQIQVVGQELFQSSATQQTDLGAQATDGFGRFFRYASCGSTTALVAGQLVTQATTSNSNFRAIGMGTVGTGVLIFTTGSNVTLAANDVAGGWVSVRSGSGNGYLYRIKSNTAATASTSTIGLEDPLQVGWLANSTLIDLIPSPYANLVVSASTTVSTPVGVAVVNTPASQFGWIQTRGPSCALMDANTAAVGLTLSASVTTAGSLTPQRGSAIAVGYAPALTIASVNNGVFLTLE